MEEQNNILTCKCPHCNEAMRIRRPAKDGKYKYVCTHCKEPFAVTFKEEEESKTPEQEPPKQPTITQPVDPRYMTIGGLMECRKGIFVKNKMYSLHEGIITIGRKNSKCPSDIMFEDHTMSRQSLKLIVEKNSYDGVSFYSYTMSVVNAKNPVIYNGDKLEIGDTVELNIDDTIILGQTKLMLK